MTHFTRAAGEDGSIPGAHDMADGNRGMSGNSYVVAELDTSSAGPDGIWVPGRHLAAIPIRIRCGHQETVCTGCAETWMYDWVFHFGRTAGGRQLREALGGDPGLEAMAARRADWDARCRLLTAGTPAGDPVPAGQG